MYKKNVGFSIFLVTIFVFPYQFFSESQIIKAIPLITFLFLSIYKFRKIRNGLRIKTDVRVFFLIWIFFEMLRNNNPQATFINAVFKILIIIFFILLFDTINFNKIKELEVSTLYILMGVFGCLALLSYIGLLFGISGAKKVDLDIGNAVILSTVGINVNRVVFPFTGGINSYSSLLGLLFVFGILFTIYYKKYRLFSFFFCIIFFSQLLLLDSRGGILFSFISILTVLLTDKLNVVRKLIKSIPIIAIAGPFIFTLGLYLFVSYFNFDLILRNSYEAYTGNSRLVIWLISLEEFLEFKLIHLIGYGEFGHFASEKSLLWADNFKSFENSDMMHPHNTNLVLLYDYGYIGIILYLLSFISILKNLNKIQNILKSKFPLIVVGLLLYISLIGTSESFFGFYYQNIFNIQLIIVLLIIKLEKLIFPQK